jgi:sugar phosphate isomerase/epimerase
MKLIWSTPEIDQFTGKELDDLLKHLNANGFAGIEPMYSTKPIFNLDTLKELLTSNDQRVIGLRTGGIALKFGVSFSNPDEIVREKAVELFFGSIKFAKDIGASLLLVGLLQGKLAPSQNYRDARRNIIECLTKCAREAEKFHLTIGLEAINRFMLGYHTKSEEIIGLLKEINMPNVKLLLDTFHMNIEESCMEETLITSAPWLTHIHLADNNRLSPGRGNINFVRIVKVLKATKYEGFVSIESDDNDWLASISESSRLLLPLIS